MRNVKKIVYEFDIEGVKNPHAIDWIRALPYVESVRRLDQMVEVVALYEAMRPSTPDRVVQDILEMLKSCPGKR